MMNDDIQYKQQIMLEGVEVPGKNKMEGTIHFWWVDNHIYVAYGSKLTKQRHSRPCHIIHYIVGIGGCCVFFLKGRGDALI